MKTYRYLCPICKIKYMGRGATKCRGCANSLRIVSPETRERIRVSKLGSRNINWKGDKVSYRALHHWVQRHYPKPELCECCHKKPPLDLANISGKYKRELSDWEYLCRSCHMRKDGRLTQAVKNLNGEDCVLTNN